MRIKTISIDGDVEGVLRDSTLNGNDLTLPGNLDRPLYLKANKVLELIGFKWNRGQKCHVGQGDSADKLREGLDSGKVVDEKQTFQFFETPNILASRMVSLADIQPGNRVLEPSAGKGAIIRAIEATGIQMELYANELQDVLASGLRNEFRKVKVFCGDFLNMKGEYDRIVMNPPFCGGQDILHVRHAYDLLSPGGRLVAIMSPSWQIASGTKYHAFRAWYRKLQGPGATVPEMLPAGTFKESGTNVASVLVVVCK